MSIKVINCSNEFGKDWDLYVESRREVTFYHLFSWKRINEISFGHTCYYLAALIDSRIVGILPLVCINSRMFGKILCSMPFVNFGGICANSPEAEILLLDKAQDIVKKERFDYLELRNLKKLDGNLQTSEHKVSMVLNLNPDSGVIWDGFKTKQRTEIRRAYKNNLRVVSGRGELLDVFYSTLAVSWHNLGTPIYRKSYFKSILDAFPENTRIFIVMLEDLPIGAALNGYFKGTAEGMWLGLLPKYRKLLPNSILYWEMIKHACENNIETFHLGRSSVNSGGEFFKKKWRAEPVQLYWQFYLGNKKEMPRLNVDNPKYKFAIKVWQNLPHRLTKILGPSISSSIP